MPTILLVDDERLFVKGLKRSLEREGYTVLVAYNGHECLELFKRENIDLVLLDLMLPGLDGLEVCRRLRRESDIAVIMLTAKGDDVDKIVGLEVGADDYVTKPFNTRELIARIKAVLRRTGSRSKESKIVQVGELLVDPARRIVKRGCEEIELTTKEFDLLYLMATNPGRVFTRENLLEAVWGTSYYADLRTVDVHVRRLREKIEENSKKPAYILTKWGVGYYFREGR